MAAHSLVIGIAGGTASGKSTVAKKIVDGLADAALDVEPGGELHEGDDVLVDLEREGDA